jgi:hypothetical protein
MIDNNFYVINNNNDIYCGYDENILHFNIEKLNKIIKPDLYNNINLISNIYNLKFFENLMIYSLMYNISKALLFINHWININSNNNNINSNNNNINSNNNNINSHINNNYIVQLYNKKNFVDYDDFFTSMFNMILSKEQNFDIIYETFKIRATLKSISKYLNKYQGNFSNHIFDVKGVIIFIYYYCYVNNKILSVD